MSLKLAAFVSVAIDKQWLNGLNLCSIGMPCKTVDCHLRSAGLQKTITMNRSN